MCKIVKYIGTEFGNILLKIYSTEKGNILTEGNIQIQSMIFYLRSFSNFHAKIKPQQFDIILFGVEHITRKEHKYHQPSYK